MRQRAYGSTLMSAIAALSLVMVACTGTDPAATTTPTATPAVDGTATPSESEQEFALPDSILEAAIAEGEVRIIDANEAELMTGVISAFNERYPDITVVYQDAPAEVRTVRTLTEIMAGQNQWDIAGSLEGYIEQFKAENAFVRLDDLPAYANYEPPYRDPDHHWVASSVVYWGLGYNTDSVQPDELPETWEGLTEPAWRGRIGMPDRPHLWFIQLWREWGPERGTQWLEAFFANDVSRRAESVDALSNFLAAGEYDIVIPAEPSTMESIASRGAPVAWYSPEPIPVAMSPMSLLNDSPNSNAAKVFLNWFISREGQIAFHESANVIPVHPDLREDPEYLGQFADVIVDREVAIRQPDDEVELLPDLLEVWQSLWLE